MSQDILSEEVILIKHQTKTVKNLEKYNKKPKTCLDVMSNQNKNTQTTFQYKFFYSGVFLSEVIKEKATAQ